MIIIGFDSCRLSFVTASGLVSDDWVIDTICNPSYSEFDLCFSSDALLAAVTRFRDIPLAQLREAAQ